MNNSKRLLAKSCAAALLALLPCTLPSRAHTEAIGYVVVAPGDVDVWFGTYHAFSEMPQTEGHALLIEPNASQVSISFSLTSPTVPTGLHEGQNLLINTAGGFTLADMESWQGAPFTGLTQTGTYTVELDPAFPPSSLKWFVDFTTPITFTINPNIVGMQIPTAGLTDNQKAVLQPFNRGLALGVGGASLTRVNLLLMQAAGNSVALGQELDQMSPLKFANFASTTAFNNDSFETAAMDMYLENQRTGDYGAFMGGNGSIDSSGLVVNDPNYDPSLQMIHGRMLAWSAPSNSVADMPGAVLGGVDMKDMKSCPSCYAPSSPWNVFIRGNVILAQGLSQADQPHFDDNSESVVIGADYRLTPHFLVGATAAYAHTDATLDPLNSSATIDSYSPGIYAAYSDSGWFANFLGRYSYNSYTESRNIDFLHQTADGATDGNEGVVDLDGGYEFHSGPWTYGPVAGVQYTHLTVNSFGESGSDANLAVDEDQSDSLRSRLGGSVRYDLRDGGVVFSPHLTATWQHEFMDESRGITSQFTNFAGGSFIVRTQGSSDDFALADIGLDAQIGHGLTVFGDYLIQAGQDNYFGQSLQAGVKVNF